MAAARRGAAMPTPAAVTHGITLRELCRVHGVRTRTVLALVREGVLEPLADEAGEPQFAASAIPRLACALRLRRELQLDVPATALALELLDELQRLRNRVRLLEGLLDGRVPGRRR